MKSAIEKLKELEKKTRGLDLKETMEFAKKEIPNVQDFLKQLHKESIETMRICSKALFAMGLNNLVIAPGERNKLFIGTYTRPAKVVRLLLWGLNTVLEDMLERKTYDGHTKEEVEAMLKNIQMATNISIALADRELKQKKEKKEATNGDNPGTVH